MAMRDENLLWFDNLLVVDRVGIELIAVLEAVGVLVVGSLGYCRLGRPECCLDMVFMRFR